MPKFPEVVPFEGLKSKTWSADGALCFYDYVGFRPPKKGEFYLSGAIIAAYRAPNDLSTSYHVVRPTHKARQTKNYVRGEAI